MVRIELRVWSGYGPLFTDDSTMGLDCLVDFHGTIDYSSSGS